MNYLIITSISIITIPTIYLICNLYRKHSLLKIYNKKLLSEILNNDVYSSISNMIINCHDFTENINYISSIIDKNMNNDNIILHSYNQNTGFYILAAQKDIDSDNIEKIQTLFKDNQNNLNSNNYSFSEKISSKRYIWTHPIKYNNNLLGAISILLSNNMITKNASIINELKKITEYLGLIFYIEKAKAKDMLFASKLTSENKVVSLAKNLDQEKNKHTYQNQINISTIMECKNHINSNSNNCKHLHDYIENNINTPEKYNKMGFVMLQKSYLNNYIGKISNSMRRLDQLFEYSMHVANNGIYSIQHQETIDIKNYLSEIKERFYELNRYNLLLDLPQNDCEIIDNEVMFDQMMHNIITSIINKRPQDQEIRVTLINDSQFIQINLEYESNNHQNIYDDQYIKNTKHFLNRQDGCMHIAAGNISIILPIKLSSLAA
jgi:hypothetical protein